jgi:DNA modification methylase
MAPDIALKMLSNREKKLCVLDPMMGSGTVLALARAHGHRSIGIDVDPLAILISTVWTSTVDSASIKAKSRSILKRARKRFANVALSQAYPQGADEETKRFIRYWFDGYARRQLAALSMMIRGVRDKTTQSVLWCAFSRLIVTKQAGASLAMDLAHSRPHKAYKTAPIKPFNCFLAAVDSVLANCLCTAGKKRLGPPPTIKRGDARKLRLPSSSVDLVLTSPPYLNAIDYMRCSKFSLVWMGLNTDKAREIRAQSIGAEVGNYNAANVSSKIIKKLRLSDRLPNRQKAILARFIEDMRAAIGEVSRVLTPNGRAIYVVGENTVRGTYIKNSEIVAAIADEVGLELAAKQTRTLPPNRRYLPPPSSRRRRGALNARMRREVILSFRKRPLRAKRAKIRRHAA